MPAIEHADLGAEDEVLLLGVLIYKEVVRVPSDVIPTAAQEESKMLEATKYLHLLAEDLRRDRGCDFTTHGLSATPWSRLSLSPARTRWTAS
ncbi:MAG: hypothetical protein EXR60_02590 [Dehalococcoidia bacterium]|nr:hypothetical protein [Dehalococcoidia bacterium]